MVASTRLRRAHRSLGIDRGGHRIGCHADAVHRRPGRRRMGAERDQELDHPRHHGRSGGRAGQDWKIARQPWHHGHGRGAGNTRIPGRQEGGQAGHARQRDGRTRLRGLSHSGGQRAGRSGRGVHPGDEDSRRRPDQHCGAVAGHRPRGFRRGSELCQTARAIRSTHRSFSGHRIQVGGHGCRHRGSAEPGPQGLLGQGKRRGCDPPWGHGEVPGLGDVRPGGNGRHPGLRRLRLHQGIPGGEALPGCQALHDRGGHE